MHIKAAALLMFLAIGCRAPSVDVSTETGEQVTGARGTTGASGAMGTTGSVGATGEMGLAGANGVTGATGPTGADGPQGPPGAQGERGATGVDGVQGAQGLQGERGATGAQGVAGATGLRGATGPTGPGAPTGTASYLAFYSKQSDCSGVNCTYPLTHGTTFVPKISGRAVINATGSHTITNCNGTDASPCLMSAISTITVSSAAGTDYSATPGVFQYYTANNAVGITRSVSNAVVGVFDVVAGTTYTVGATCSFSSSVPATSGYCRINALTIFVSE